jgi:VanZ family protein
MINAIKIDTISKREWTYSLIFLFFFPIVDEIFQHFTPQRIPSIYDAFADVSGGLIGAFLRSKI